MGILLGWQNLLEQAGVVLGASSEAAGLGLRSLLTPQIAEVWRSGPWGSSTIDIDADLGAAQALNVVALAAPRDGLLPSPTATVALQASAQAAPSRTNLQANGESVVPGGGTWIIGPNTTDLGAVAGPDGASGARRLGTSSATGAGTNLRTGARASPGGVPYRLTVWARSNAAAPTRGTLMEVVEATEPSLGGTSSTVVGVPMWNAVDGTWRQFSTTVTTRSTTQSLQVRWAIGWQAGAEIEIWGASLVRLAEGIETGVQPLGLTPWGLWGWCSASPVTARYLRLSFTGAAADAYLQLGRLWAGPALITSRAAAFGHSVSVADPGSAARAGVSGLRVAQRGTPYRVQQFSAPLLSSAEATQLQRAVLAVGSTGQVIAARHHLDLAGTAMFGAFAAGAPVAQRVTPTLWRADFSIEEDL